MMLYRRERRVLLSAMTGIGGKGASAFTCVAETLGNEPLPADSPSGRGSKPSKPFVAASSSARSVMTRKLLISFTLLALWLAGSVSVFAQEASPFKDLPGRWVGQGRIGLKNGNAETVKCRATYFLNDNGQGLRQNIRCASASGKIEVKSVVTHADGKLSGTWRETIYELGGNLDGEITERGFRISVKGSDLAANMDVIVVKDRQIVEIQFFNSTLVGLTLILNKG